AAGETSAPGRTDSGAPGGSGLEPDSSSGETTRGADGDSGPPTDSGSILLDVGSDTPLPVDCKCGTDEWSYVWLANSSDGTVSKINTETMVEEGRYITRPDRAGNPSRTSVSVNARSVAVANRHGGLVKIWARDAFCDESRNGQPGLQTSSGAGDVLPWGQDDCVDWYLPFNDWTTQRPVAWSGRLDEQHCQDEAVWTAGCGGGFMPGFADAFSDVEVALVAGLDGSVLDTVIVEGLSCSGFGPYGGAVAPDGKLWLVINNGDLASIDRDTMQTEVFPPASELSPYGLAVDRDGMVWVSSYATGFGAGRLDPGTGQWETVPGFSGQGGIAQSVDGRIWTAYSSGGNGVVWIDPATMTVGGTLPIPGGSVKGVSGDIHGNVWAVTGVAHKIDTATETIVDSYAGLVTPYTYSDMTGAGIQNTACEPEG
ncbi:MAG: hypothetical protein JKY37_30785, partial [Nannocystaceae bacterium]|nr:hypothetical protein [Nannocystaceae bacterium]